MLEYITHLSVKSGDNESFRYFSKHVENKTRVRSQLKDSQNSAVTQHIMTMSTTSDLAGNHVFHVIIDSSKINLFPPVLEVTFGSHMSTRMILRTDAQIRV